MAFDKNNTKAPRKRKKVCQFCVEKKNFIDYKDTATLRHYISEGYYVLMKFTSGPEFPAELDRILGITDGILRRLITLRAE